MIGILILLSMATAVLLFVQYSTASVGNRELNTTLSLLLCYYLFGQEYFVVRLSHKPLMFIVIKRNCR